MSDWTEATDLVPARRELTDAERARLKALFELRRRQGLNHTLKAMAPSACRIDSDFDEGF